MDASAARMNSGTRDLREPYIRTHFTDMMSPMFTQQTHPYCKDFDLKLRYCLEAYGKPMAYTKCKDIEEDLHECLHRGKQVCETFSFNSYLHSFSKFKFFYVLQIGRLLAMENERKRQYKAGERTKEGYNAETPKPDSF